MRTAHTVGLDAPAAMNALEQNIMQALADNPRLHRADPREISVQAVDGDVILLGTVGSVAEREEAVRTARHVEGVRSVENRLGVRSVGAAGLAFKAYVEWRQLSVAVQDAYDRWTRAARDEAAAAFLRYRLALDQEERSSLEYAWIVEGPLG